MSCVRQVQLFNCSKVLDFTECFDRLDRENRRPVLQVGGLIGVMERNHLFMALRSLRDLTKPALSWMSDQFRANHTHNQDEVLL